MRYNIINSSSQGNAIIVEDFLLLDIGVSYAKIKQYLNKIKLIFISHCRSPRPSTNKNNKTTCL